MIALYGIFGIPLGVSIIITYNLYTFNNELLNTNMSFVNTIDRLKYDITKRDRIIDRLEKDSSVKIKKLSKKVSFIKID